MKEDPGEGVRLALLSTHYRQPLNWNYSIIDQCHTVLDRLYRVLNSSDVSVEDTSAPAKVVEALCDDLNTSVALAEINNLSNQLSKAESEEDQIKIKSKLIASANLLGILQQDPSDWLGYGKTDKVDNKELVEELINKRNEARSNKDFNLADQIRSELNDMNIEIEDTPDGTIWKSKK